MTPDNDFDPILVDDNEARRLYVAVPIASEGPLGDEDRKRVIEAVNVYRKTHGYQIHEIAKQLGIKPSTLSEILSGKYGAKVSPDALDAKLRDLNNWMELDGRRRRGQQPGKPITNTRVVKRVKDAVRMCRRLSCMGYVTGPGGVGKTVTIKEMLRLRTETGIIYIAAHRDNLSSSKMLDEIATALGVGRTNRRRQWRGITLFRRIESQLAGSHRLLVVDEAHKLKVDTLELLREIHDTCNIPILLLGEFKLAEKIRSTTSEDSGQLESRFGVKFDVLRAMRMSPDGSVKDEPSPIFTKTQIREIIAAPGLKFTNDAVDYLTARVANVWGGGHIRAVQYLVALAVRYSRRRQEIPDDKPVTVSAADLRVMRGEADKSLMDYSPYWVRQSKTA